MRPLFALIIASSFFVTPTFAQEAPAPGVTTEEAAPAEEAASPKAAEVVETVSDATELVEDAVSAAQSKSWPVVIGLILIAVVTVLRKVGIESKIAKGSKALPWLTLSLAAAANIGAALLGGMAWDAVLTATLASAGIAMGGWDLAKLFRGSETEIPTASFSEE